MKSQRIPGAVPLHAEVTGQGAAVLLVHGFGGSARNFRPQARALGERFRVVAFDVRGHARSGAPEHPAAYRPERFVEDVGRVLDHVGAERAVVGGLSMGAGIAMRFARAHPERVRGLVLAAVPPGAAQRGQAAWAERFADAIERDGLEAAGERHAWGEGSGFDRQAARLIRLGFREHAPHALAHTLRALLATQPDPEAAAAELAGLGLPTLVIVGGADAISRAPSRALARRLPGARLVEVEAAGHVVNLADRETFNRELGAFLEALPDV